MKDSYKYFIFILILIICFIIPIFNWISYSLNSDLFSYSLIIPIISGQLIISKNKRFLMDSEIVRPWLAIIPAIIAFSLLAIASHYGREERLIFQMTAFLLLVWGGTIYTYGMKYMYHILFPMLFLIFMVPIPGKIVSQMEIILQYSSAEIAFKFIKLAGIPIFRFDELNFALPGITLSVAQECSGIRSTLILFLCSLLAGHLMFKNYLSRFVLPVIAILLGIARNAFRILVLAYLSVRIDPSYINSAIHHKGGTLFFIISLVPFMISIWIIRRIEKSPRQQNRPIRVFSG